MLSIHDTWTHLKEPLFAVTWLAFFKQFSKINAVIFYKNEIFGE